MRQLRMEPVSLAFIDKFTAQFEHPIFIEPIAIADPDPDFQQPRFRISLKGTETDLQSILEEMQSTGYEIVTNVIIESQGLLNLLEEANLKIKEANSIAHLDIFNLDFDELDTLLRTAESIKTFVEVYKNLANIQSDILFLANQLKH